MSEMDFTCESPEQHEEPPTKRQKTTEIKNDDFENVRTNSFGTILKTEAQKIVKLLEKCLSSFRCDIAQPAQCKCRCCLYTKYGHVVFVPHDGHQYGEQGPGEKCAECISVEGTVRGKYGVEISDHLPLSPEVRRNLACHFRVFREILSKMFSTTIQDLRKRMAQVKIENMPTLQEEMLKLQEEIKSSGGQLDTLGSELQRIFVTTGMSGVDPLEMENDLPMTHNENAPELLDIRKVAIPSLESLKAEIKRLETETTRLEKKIQHLEEEKTDMKKCAVQSVPIKFYTSDRK
ncbi:hypothetical protein NHQ30_011143 [Ciborinia camelliae]|nr:hypothetical protein NHQ30_011143 [Ciborinia camelliae]